MLDAKVWFLALLGLVAVVFISYWLRHVLSEHRQSLEEPGSRGVLPRAWDLAVGFVTNFFDTLGIGSYATTTALYRMRRSVADELIPGTLNVGHLLPTFAQAFIYTSLVRVEMTTLVSMIAAAVAGSWIGAGWVARWPRHWIQIGMGLALFAAAGLLLMKILNLFPGGGDALGLSGTKLAFALAVNFGLGALMTLGVGLYAPCMILVSLLGLNPTTAFPIMMGSCAFLMPAANIRFIQYRRYALSAALGLAIGGVPAVLLAAFWLYMLRVDQVRILVLVVVLYAATMMLLSGLRRVASNPVSAEAPP